MRRDSVICIPANLSTQGALQALAVLAEIPTTRHSMICIPANLSTQGSAQALAELAKFRRLFGRPGTF
jgi:hypothetical protein